MTLPAFVHEEFKYIEERYNLFHREAYSNFAINYALVVTHYANEIKEYKNRLEEFMELTDKKVNFIMTTLRLIFYSVFISFVYQNALSPRKLEFSN